jgi:mono/diheme cytochrome c family protein
MQKRLWLVCLLMLFTTSLAGAVVPKKRGSDYDEGRKIWKRSCWQCHGKKAEGDGPAAAAIAGGVPTLRGGIVVKPKRNDFIRSVLGGKGLMPSFAEELERPDAKRVIIYLEKLDARNGEEPEEKEEKEEKEEEKKKAEKAAEEAEKAEEPENDVMPPVVPPPPVAPAPPLAP